jgi:hypothetical protein
MEGVGEQLWNPSRVGSISGFAASRRETTRGRNISQSSAITQTASPPARVWFDLGTNRSVRERPESEDALRGEERLTCGEGAYRCRIPRLPCSPPCLLVSAAPATTSAEREITKYVRERERKAARPHLTWSQLSLPHRSRDRRFPATSRCQRRLPLFASQRCAAPNHAASHRCPTEIFPSFTATSPGTPSTGREVARWEMRGRRRGRWRRRHEEVRRVGRKRRRGLGRGGRFCSPI